MMNKTVKTALFLGLVFWFILNKPNVVMALEFSELNALISQTNYKVQQAGSAYASKKAKEFNTFSTFMPQLALKSTVGLEREDAHETKEQKLGAGFNASVNIFNSFRDTLRSKNSTLMADITKGRQQLTVRERLALVQILYVRARRIIEELPLHKKEMVNVRTYRIFAEKKVKAGQTTTSDVLEFAQMKDELAAKAIELEAELEFVLQNIAYLLPSQQVIEKAGITDSLGTILKTLQTQPEKGQSPQVTIARSQSQAAHNEYRIAKRSWMPSLDFESDYKYETNKKSSVVASDPIYDVKLMLKVPIFDRGLLRRKRKAALHKANELKFALQDAQANYQLQRSKIDIQINKLKKRLVLIPKRIRRAEEYRKLSFLEYKRGLRSSREVAESENSLIGLKETKLRLEEALATSYVERLRQF